MIDSRIDTHPNIFNERIVERSNFVRTSSTARVSDSLGECWLVVDRVVKNETEITDAQVNLYDDFYAYARCIVGTFEMRVTAEPSFIGCIRLHVIV